MEANADQEILIDWIIIPYLGELTKLSFGLVMWGFV